MRLSIFLAIIFVGLQQVLASDVKVKEIAPGVIRISTGVTEEFTPFGVLDTHPKTEVMQAVSSGSLPFDINEIIVRKNKRGCSVFIPLADQEQLYGFGLQMGSFTQRGLKKKPIVNDFPSGNLGYSHAPQPFYVSTSGYGILVNTAKYTTFYCGTENELQDKAVVTKDNGNTATIASAEDLYKAKKNGNYVFIDIPGTEGVEVFVLLGPSMKQVVERYNLLSGGGCLPPMWGLGIKYRTKYDFNQQQVMEIANYFRTKKIPCDVLGLEPRWQTASYSCSYVWDKNRFPDHKGMAKELDAMGLKLNLWEHAYVHPSSPIHDSLRSLSGDFLVWNGLVPDFTLPQTRKLFSDYHQTLIDGGVTSFKMDECDNSNISTGNSNWGFPDMSVFPSGMDGERMHQVFGSLYLKMMNDLFRKNNIRTFQDYRSSGLFMSSVPATLYSDTYDHKEYIQMMCNAAFGGLLWSPELRESSTIEELFHRIQLVLLSPQAVLDTWYLDMPAWWQPDKEKNNKGEMLPNVEEMEDIVRTLINQRMSLLPYLYSAFFNYYQQGTPPFRPLVMDYVEDKKVWTIDDQYMMGNCIMAAPLYQGSNKREVYFPKGDWYDFHNGKKYEGGKSYEIETTLSNLPVYVKSGSILPVADPVQSVKPNTVFNITCRVYGKENIAEATLIEDDGVSFDYEKGEFCQLFLNSDSKEGKVKRSNKTNIKKRYTIRKWEYHQ